MYGSCSFTSLHGNANAHHHVALSTKTRANANWLLATKQRHMQHHAMGWCLFVTAAAAASCALVVTGLQAYPPTTTTALLAEGVPSRSTDNYELRNNPRLERWEKRWSEGKTRWHRKKVHPSLLKYVHLLESAGNNIPTRILVALCGKTVDMEYLAHEQNVAQVVGVDGVRKATEDFAREHPSLDIQSVGIDQNGFEEWQGKSILLLTGDFFDLKPSEPRFDAVWDRAAMVAIEPKLREAYVNKLGELLKNPGGKILLSTYVRPNGDTTTGPPFSIDEEEVRRLFESKPWVESVQVLDFHSAITMESLHKALFLYFRMGNLQENIFLITTK